MFKKLFAIFMIAALLVGCAHDKTINGKYYDTYGFIDKDDMKDPCVRYHASTGNVVWSIVFFETIFVPVWLLGYDLYEPKQVDPTLPGCKSAP